MKASIGRIVHFYTSDPSGEGGPFAAIVTNVHDVAGQFVNLVYFPHYGNSGIPQGSVYEKSHEHATSQMYWVEPPRV
jgi:hypothetical protein